MKEGKEERMKETERDREKVRGREEGKAGLRWKRDI